MQEIVLLTDYFQKTVADAANGRIFDSDYPIERRAHAIHQHLMENDPSYKDEFEAYRSFGETKAFKRLCKKLEEINPTKEALCPKDMLKSAWVMACHSPALIKTYLYEQRLLKYAEPLLERAVQ